MRSRRPARWSMVMAIGFCAATSVALAQTPAADSRGMVPKKWNETGQKIVKLAEEFPEDKYEFRRPKTLDLKRLDLSTTFIEHTGEHYGHLAVYYRLNGLVPPESRANQP
jgi:hypothetical protein